MYIAINKYCNQLHNPFNHVNCIWKKKINKTTFSFMVFKPFMVGNLTFIVIYYRDPNFEFLIPSTMSDIESGDSDDVEVVDGLALLPNDYIGKY